MNVAELIAWLQTKDQGATVEVVTVTREQWHSDAGWVIFNPEDNSDYSDMRGNPHAKGQPDENSRTLYLGSC